MTGREAALKALAAARKNGAWSDIYLDHLARSGVLSGKEVRLAYRICLGVLQNRTLCIYVIDRVSSVPFRKMQPLVADVLLVSVYQLLFMDRIPSHAAVSEGVELCKKYNGTRAAGLVNAVLRRVAEQGVELLQVQAQGVQRLSLLYSHPLWLVDLYTKRLGLEGCEALLSASNTPCCTDLQVNTLKTDATAELDALLAEHVAVSAHPWLRNCLCAEDIGNIAELSAFKNGHIYVQDAAARLAVCAADLKPGMMVIDGCAAPGGKSFAAAIDMKDQGHIISCDLHAKKLPQIVSGAARLGIKCIETCAVDGRTPVSEWTQKADAVLADVPCSGLGVIRKKPDIRWKDPKPLEALPAIQLAILKNLSAYVKPGGTLLYSTCTVLQRENEDVVLAFLKTAPFDLQPFVLPGGFQAPDGMITLWPHIHGTDGFFICRMRRRG
jgi:16S rRNA (cytosine967-C5)-methyltransferase